MKLEIDGVEYDDISMKREDVFGFWESIVILCSLSDDVFSVFLIQI